jgi:hypothetical protein
MGENTPSWLFGTWIYWVMDDGYVVIGFIIGINFHPGYGALFFDTTTQDRSNILQYL